MSALTLALITQLAGTPACSVPGMTDAFWPVVVRKESGYDPWALHDDDTDREYHPASAEDAEATARRLMSDGHSVGVGLSQLTARSEQQFSDKFGKTIREALDACTNMHVGARFYVDRALRIYHAGSPDKGADYAASIVGNIQPGAMRTISTTPPRKKPNPHASDTEVWE